MVRRLATVDTDNPLGIGPGVLEPKVRVADINLPERLSVEELSATYVAWENAAKHGAIGNDVADSRTAIDAAMLACSTAGGGVVFLPAGKYVVGGPLTPRSNVTLYGPGASIRTSVTGNIVYARTVALKDWTVEGVTFIGSVNSFPTVPTRARTTSGPGAVSAIQTSGDTDTDNPGGR